MDELEMFTLEIFLNYCSQYSISLDEINKADEKRCLDIALANHLINIIKRDEFVTFDEVVSKLRIKNEVRNDE